MGSIYQVKNGKHKDEWRGNANLPKRWDAEKNKWQYPKKVVYGLDRQEVARKVNEIENKVMKNRYADAGRLTLGAYIDNWISIYCDDPDLAVTTKSLYKMYVDVHIKPALGHVPLRDILPSTIQQFYNKLKKGGYSFKDPRGNVKTRPALKDKTISKIHSLLNKAFRDAVADKLIYDNPCEKVKKLKREPYEPTVYNEAQMKTLLTITEGTFDEVCIVLGSICGLRRGEVFGIRVKEDLDFTNRTITVSQTKTRFDKWVIKDPKSEKSKRTIQVKPFVVEIIKRYISSLKVVPERLCSEYLPDSYSKHFKKLLADNGLPHIRFHDLRHFAGSILAKYHVPVAAIQSYLGHADQQTTSIYINNLSDMADLASNVMEKIYKGN